MKRYFSVAIAIVMTLSMTACGGDNNVEVSQESTTEVITENAVENKGVEANDGKALVAYFTYADNAELTDSIEASTSASINLENGRILGNTAVIAEKIANSVGGDLHSITTVDKYSQNYDDVVAKGKEEGEKKARPALSSHIDNLDDYDTIFIGYPNWWYDMPMAMYTFFDEYDFSNKTIIPFCTSGGSGFSDTIQAIKELEPNANVIDSTLAISAYDVNDSDDVLADWLSGLGY